MNDINSIIKGVVENIDFNEVFQASLKAQIEQTVKHVLKDALGSYSPLSKGLEKVVEEQLKIDLSRFTLPQYSAFVLDQLQSVLREQVSEERAAALRRKISEKLSPHLEREIDFDVLFEAIESGLRDSLEGEDPCCDQKYFVQCKKDARAYSYSTRDYYQLAVYDGDKAESSNEIAILCLHEDSCYHSRGKRNDPLAERFASYAHIGTKIKGVREIEKLIERGDY